MDFSKEDIPKILKSAIRNRFSDFDPYDFEDFIAQLFIDNNYLVEQTKYTGDFGADLIVEKDNLKIVVQVKRYGKDNKVGVKDINQLIGAKEYYKCDSSIIVTTSSYSPAGRKLAENTNVKLYDWEHLLKIITDTYLDGKDYYEYFGKEVNDNSNPKNLEIKVKKVDFDITLKGNKPATVFTLDVINNSEKNLHTNVIKSIYIGSDKRQVECTAFLSDHFTSGTIYAGCTVEVAFIFPAEKITSVSSLDKIIIELYEGNGEPVNNTYSVNINYNTHRKTEEEKRSESDKWWAKYKEEQRNEKIKKFLIVVAVIIVLFVLIKMCNQSINY